jgi:hypothetical protein
LEWLDTHFQGISRPTGGSIKFNDPEKLIGSTDPDLPIPSEPDPGEGFIDHAPDLFDVGHGAYVST